MTMTIAIAASSFQRSALSAKRAARDDRKSGGRIVEQLDETRIAGSFSLLAGAPITIAARPGLVIWAHSGVLWITQHGTEDRFIRMGQRFVADRAGPLVVSALETAEVYVDWPCADAERLSPGLEPVEATV